MTIPKGFIELHLARAYEPILVKVDLIGFLSPVLEIGDRLNKKKVNWTHVVSLAHNNGGFDVSESYNEVCKKMVEAETRDL